jgi:excisionase family DNA binding protein
MDIADEDRLLTPAETAAMLEVDSKTVSRWEKAGRLASVRTLGGHRRYYEDQVRALLRDRAEGGGS